MGRLKKKTIYIVAGALSCIGCLVMMAFPSIALNAAQKGITLWASSVLPALLPFFICANFMTALGLPVYIGRIFEKPFQKLFGAPGVSAFIFSISITSGYPMGAKLIGDFGRSGAVSRSEARRMLTFCSTSGPLFMLGAVGAGMLASPAAGAVIALSHYFGALLNGLLFCIFSPPKQQEPRNGPVKKDPCSEREPAGAFHRFHDFIVSLSGDHLWLYRTFYAYHGFCPAFGRFGASQDRIQQELYQRLPRDDSGLQRDRGQRRNRPSYEMHSLYLPDLFRRDLHLCPVHEHAFRIEHRFVLLFDH